MRSDVANLHKAKLAHDPPENHAPCNFDFFAHFFTRLFDFTGGVDVLYYLRNYGVSILIGILCSMPIFNYLEKKTQRLPLVQTAFLVLVLVMCTGYLVDATYNPFLYWNF